MKSAFRMVSAVAAAVAALVLVPMTAGTASAGEPGRQAPGTDTAATADDVTGDPGWQGPSVDVSE
ncbi:hypothetical protein [Streptomyces lydicus]|uniref:hypothetical protein n=1 Tax=Streptomyces lydicus TaxID=47763 RepID=UPI0013E9052E|nr:hypothetical protein [Streptomyces lydicus]MCZ1006986.1 hypothetical protein [Streptomyces lydicus]